MTDATPDHTPRTNKNDEDVEDAVIVEEIHRPAPAPEEVVVDEARAPEEIVVEEDTRAPEVIVIEKTPADQSEPFVATTDPGAVDTPSSPTPAQQVVYVQAPVAPRKLGNRGVGLALVAAAAVLFTAVLAGLTILFTLALRGTANVAFLAEPTFYIPTLFFFIGFALLVLIANRANWAAYIVGSLLVGLFVYFGTIGLGLLLNNVILSTPDEAAAAFAGALRNPFIIAAAILAREVTMWVGVAIARRGRSLKVRNAEARDAYERDLAEKRAEHERGATAAASAV